MVSKGQQGQTLTSGFPAWSSADILWRRRVNLQLHISWAESEQGEAVRMFCVHRI